MAHSALFGIAIGILSGIDIVYSSIATLLLFSVILASLYQKNQERGDAVLSAVSHFFLACGIVLLAKKDEESSHEIISVLFGNLANITQHQVWLSVIICIAVIMFLWRYISQLLLIVYDEELAIAEGVPVKKLQFGLLFVSSLVIAVAINIVGVLLISAILVFPALILTQWVNSPINSLFFASIISFTAMIIGIAVATSYNQAPGPLIVITLAVIYIFSTLFKALRKD